MERLTLQVRRYSGPGRWYWSLSDSKGAFIADHEVDLPESDQQQWAAFTRLNRYLRRNIDPARPLSSEAQLIRWLGEWIAAHAFGSIAPALAKRAPVTVAVQFSADIPADIVEGASALLYRPWELTVVNGKPLARQGVSLVMVPPGAPEPGTSQPKEKQTAAELRILGVFSLPADAPALILREQRHELVRLVNQIARGSRKAIELTTLQYGVDAARLRDALEDGRGWDIVHFSGHGLVDGLVLEGPSGEQEVLPTAELIDLLRGNRHRLRLVVLSSCNSAAAPPAESLAARFGEDGSANSNMREDGQPTLSVLAAEAAVTLDCAVLAMRYVVDDDFSIALGEHLYQALLGAGQPLPRALQIALPKALGDRPRPGVPPLSVGIPALFGQRCMDLSLAPPVQSRPQTYDVNELRMASFPAPADNLVGRSAVMGRASRVLGGLSWDGPVGVLLSGPAGIGKTACAVEVAYHHERAFDRLVWYQAPGAGEDISGTLTEFAFTLERELPDFHMREALAEVSALTAFLSKFTELMETKSVLVVLDGVDELLTSEGGWRDDRWARLVSALASHRGFSRVLLTARQPPRPLPVGIAIESVDPLSAEESVLLARRLPRLGALLRGTRSQPAEKARRLAASALTQADGNPDALLAIDHSKTTVTARPSPAYVDLVARWTAEL